ncbi:28S ribosomal protein S14, mitochondrial-like [Monomorium pharaonis]|uniref:28S ribosomal protein S14, mitochondrial n=1 Tax=Monomorium pharaonis TaxID=307658 RepID=UPI0017470A0F|nr:28S ribosomal protein S14, mitochondrial [Monomorium pharaonis]XP_036150797.1 28S ribosomal protein S14, mitochondrial-like [Monomorium pharaonis]
MENVTRKKADPVNMAALRSSVSAVVCGILPNINLLGHGLQQVRNYVGCRVIRDQKRRRWVKEYAEERLRLVVLKRNDILPIEIRELAGKQIDETIPRQTALRQLTPRCVVTSRAYGTVQRWRVSRFIFRYLVDYNKMAGVQRAIW